MITPETIRYRGRSRKVIGTERVRGREYLLLRRLGNAGRIRYQALDRAASPDGEMRTLHVLPRAQHTFDLLRLLSNVSESSYPVPTLLDYQPRGDSVWVVTRWIWGESLRRYLKNVERKKRPPISPFQAVKFLPRLTNQICHYSKSAFHGDIRPDNLIISPSPHQLALVDFGTAWRIVHTMQRHAGDGMNAPYAAPERHRNEPADLRSEQFSVMTVFYEMLTGEIPYDRLGGLAYRIESDKPVSFIPPSDLALEKREVSSRHWQQIDEVTHRGLCLDAGGRFQTGSEWIAATRTLLQTLDVDPSDRVQTGPIGWLEHIRRWLAR